MALCKITPAHSTSLLQRAAGGFISPLTFRYLAGIKDAPRRCRVKYLAVPAFSSEPFAIEGFVYSSSEIGSNYVAFVLSYSYEVA
ncbi:hypothetical protein CEXT_292581 [Caerostris extrusa]|uniref:Uncharacterized protein n=1 Tax=Caerostris extrusa TaxID=172846 RepID=A0AAV4W718_CAEEX|nr:hypothetical protein CEXT_292581 [Caerostris extrusa]